jgi:hypothetical protein
LERDQLDHVVASIAEFYRSAGPNDSGR